MINNFEKKLIEISNQYQITQEKLSDMSISSAERVELSKKYASLEQILDSKNIIEKIEKQLTETKNILKETKDEELLELAKLDKEDLENKLLEQNHYLKKLLIPKDIDDDKNAILEIRAGTGGDEAALFSMVLMKMYQKYAEIKKWKSEILSFSETNIGGCKEAIISFSGKDLF